MSEITGLGYIGLTGPIEEWCSLAEDLGLEAVAQSSSADVRFRIDDRAWRIAVSDGARGLAYIGWEVGSRAGLRDLRETLEAAEVVVEADMELARERGVLELLTCRDPSGIALEFFFGAEVSNAPFRSPNGARFVTTNCGEALGLGHVVLLVDDEAATNHFYMDLLGFQHSDTIMSGHMRATFAHTNPRHHSLAFAATGGRMKSRLEHFMLEVDDLDTVGRALDRVNKSGVPVTVTLGKHANDKMTSFYLQTPSGCDLEYGTGGLLIRDPWVPTWFRRPSMWGHQRMPSIERAADAISKIEVSG